MNCWRVQNLIAPLLDNELPAGESEAVADHLEQCPPCRGVVESVAALPEFPQLKLDADIESSLWAEFDRCLAARTADPTENLPVLLPANAPVPTVVGSTRLPSPYRTVDYRVAVGSNPTLTR
jgi:anti-sigma factor RsiW